MSLDSCSAERVMPVAIVRDYQIDPLTGLKAGTAAVQRIHKLS
jgi:hypothetical protein